MCINVYKMFNEEDIVMLNKRFHNGRISNKSSLDFGISSSKKNNSWLEQLAYLLRSIIVDHVFEDGNKRTAALLIIVYYTELEIGFDPEKISRTIIEIAKHNVKDISKIKRMIKDVVR